MVVPESRDDLLEPENLLLEKVDEGQLLATRGRAERAANRFAAALLMPEAEVLRLWREYTSNAEFREDILASRFYVSLQALRTRAAELGLIR